MEEASSKDYQFLEGRDAGATGPRPVLTSFLEHQTPISLSLLHEPFFHMNKQEVRGGSLRGALARPALSQVSNLSVEPSCQSRQGCLMGLDTSFSVLELLSQ